jgi:hypothetical protein
MSKRFDKRIHFIACVLNEGGDIGVANCWYVDHDAHKLTTEQALAAFRAWLPEKEAA